MILVKVIGFSKIRQQALESPKLLRPTKVRPIKDGKVITKVRPPLRILVSFIYSLIFRFDSLIFQVLRVADCTVLPDKLRSAQKKLKSVGYIQKYTQGSFVPVFVTEGPHRSGVRVEVSPLWNGIIEKQNLAGDILVNHNFFPTVLFDTLLSRYDLINITVDTEFLLRTLCIFLALSSYLFFIFTWLSVRFLVN